MRIALDASGGDHGVGPNLAGALLALDADPELVVTLVGNEEELTPLIPAERRERLPIAHAPQKIGMTEKPAEAMRAKPNNSIAKSWQLLATKSVDAIVSAGNTGAMVAGGLFTRKFLKSVHRPGIATIMPTAKGRCVIMDVGANVFAKPRHLLEYGAMGAMLAKYRLGIENPTIGLMNVGEEEGKGHDLAQETYALFQTSSLKPRFAGNIEGRDLHMGKVDVVVTDGFVGNVILKLSEGLFEFVMGMVSQSLKATLTTEKDVASATLKSLVQKYHYSAVGGAPLLGVDGVCIICHGSSNDRAIASAIGVASNDVRIGLNEKIVEELAKLPLDSEPVTR